MYTPIYMCVCGGVPVCVGLRSVLLSALLPTGTTGTHKPNTDTGNEQDSTRCAPVPPSIRNLSRRVPGLGTLSAASQGTQTSTCITPDTRASLLPSGHHLMEFFPPRQGRAKTSFPCGRRLELQVYGKLLCLLKMYISRCEDAKQKRWSSSKSGQRRTQIQRRRDTTTG